MGLIDYYIFICVTGQQRIRTISYAKDSVRLALSQLDYSLFCTKIENAETRLSRSIFWIGSIGTALLPSIPDVQMVNFSDSYQTALGQKPTLTKFRQAAKTDPKPKLRLPN